MGLMELNVTEFCKLKNKSKESQYPYVIKQLMPSLPKEDLISGLEDLKNEVHHLKEISHPNIIRIRGVSQEFDECSHAFVILDRIQFTLNERIHDWKLQELTYSKGLVRKYFRIKSTSQRFMAERVTAAYGIASALNYLHSKQIIYRDLKPGNVGIDALGEVKLFDFGLSKKLNPKERIGNKYLMTGLTGTMRYMAPEIFEGKPYNLSADVYSFGILFWYMLSLKIPFANYDVDMLSRLVASGSCRLQTPTNWKKEIVELMKQCWDNDPNQRPTFQNIQKILGKVIS